MFTVPTLLLTKKSVTFPGLSRIPIRNFTGPFWSPQMLKYEDKTLPSPPDPCPSSLSFL